MDFDLNSQVDAVIWSNAQNRCRSSSVRDPAGSGMPLTWRAHFASSTWR